MNNRQQVFVNEYLKCWNASEAARRAGYSDKTAYSIGQENLKKPEIKAEIDARIAEIKMSANEVLIRLANMGRSNIADFAHVQTDKDLSELGEAGELVKKFKRKITRTVTGGEYEEIELELYDAQAPLINIGKQHGLFSDRHIIEVQLEKEVDGILDKLEGLLPPELYDRVLSAISGTETGRETPTEPQGAAVE